MDEDKLYIPYGLSIDQEYFPGFGGRELRQFFVGILGSGIIGGAAAYFYRAAHCTDSCADDWCGWQHDGCTQGSVYSDICCWSDI